MRAPWQERENVASFGNRCTRMLNTLIHQDVAPNNFNPFRNAMCRAYVLAFQTSSKFKAPGRDCRAALLTRQTSPIRRDAHARNSKPPDGAGFPGKSTRSPRPSRSPRAQRHAQLSASASSQSSIACQFRRASRQKSQPSALTPQPKHGCKNHG